MSDAIEYTDLLINGVNPDKVNQIQILSEQISELRKNKKEIEDVIESLTEELSNLFEELKLQKVAFPNYSISYNTTTTKTISADILKHVMLSKRIDPTIIGQVMEEATKVTVSAPKAKIYPKRAKE